MTLCLRKLIWHMTKKVRTRFAPSPTGYLHVGGARTALFNFLYAKATGGEFILRIEDTDQARSTEESYHKMLESMEWLGLTWDEGPGVEGPHAPYRQSERLDTYIEQAQKLIETGHAYTCFCSAEELEKKKAQREAMGLPPVYDGKCRSLTPEERQEKMSEGIPHVIRFRTPSREILVKDLVQGNVRFDSSLIGDFIIVKSDGFPSYNFAVVVDDHLMEISHVIRGVGHLSNTPRQIVIYQALGWEEPVWAHVSEIVGSDHKKLSKRHGATAITAFRDLGYPAKAFVNYMSLLGWSPPDGVEYMTPEKLYSQFDIARCSKSPAMFDVFDMKKAVDVELSVLSPAELVPYLFPKSKMNWLSNLHIRDLPEDEYIEQILPFVKNTGLVPEEEFETNHDRLRSILLSLRVYLDYYFQIGNYIGDFFREFSEDMVTPPAMEFVRKPFFAELASLFLSKLSADNFTTNSIKAAMDESGKELGLKGKDLFMSLRVANTGKTEGLELPIYLELLGVERVTDRLKKTISLAKKLALPA